MKEAIASLWLLAIAALACKGPPDGSTGRTDTPSIWSAVVDVADAAGAAVPDASLGLPPLGAPPLGRPLVRSPPEHAARGPRSPTKPIATTRLITIAPTTLTSRDSYRVRPAQRAR